MQINVTKTFLPPIDDYKSYLDGIWQRGQVTNNGPLVRQFDSKIKNYLNVDYFHFVTNGTIALQIAIESLGIKGGEIITTPFSYVATISAILWQKCVPVFVDIDPQTFCINPKKIEAVITKNTKAIMPVHVFGNACDIETIDKIAKKHNLKIIYDGAHSFGINYKGKSLLSYGDISVCSFHATKIFHTIEGGCVATNNKEVSDRVGLIKKFGHLNDEHHCLGLNAKASEFQAAMGLCNLRYINQIISKRKELVRHYDSLLIGAFQKPVMNKHIKYNFAYYPICFESEEQTQIVIEQLARNDIHPRRYFYPSLNKLPYMKNSYSCPISEDISKRIICLPLYVGLEHKTIDFICNIIKNVCYV